MAPSSKHRAEEQVSKSPAEFFAENQASESLHVDATYLAGLVPILTLANHHSCWL